MKKYAAVCLVLIGLGICKSHAALQLYEPFAYTNVGGLVSTNNTNIWITSGSSSNDAYVASGSLYQNLLNTPGGNSMTNGGNGLSLRRLIGTTNTSGTIFFSILLQVGQGGSGFAANTQICSLMSSDNSTVATTVMCKTNGAGFSFGVQKNGGGSVNNSTVYLFGEETVLLVGSYTVVPGGSTNDSVSLWVNPSSSTFGAASPPTATVTTTKGTNVTNIDRFNFRQAGDVPAFMQWDELRVGTTWADVTPSSAAFITTQPTNQTKNANKNATFSVVAGGAYPLSYQWQENGASLSDGGGVVGSATASLTISNVFGTNDGNYDVIVTAGLGSPVTSSVVTLTVKDPVVNTKPANQKAAPGDNVTFNVVATGTQPLTYVWQRNGTNLTDGGNISGSATASLTISSISSNDCVPYTSIVSSIYGSVTNTATLTFEDPLITTQPVSQSGDFGTNFILSVSVTGTPPFSYQWLQSTNELIDGGDLEGSESNMLVITGASFSNSGPYIVVVTGGAGVATSSVATITVKDPYIAGQPTKQIAFDGGSATFAVNALGTAPVSYQWKRGTNFLSDGGNVSGSATATLTLDPVSQADATNGNYSVVVSGAGSPVTSSSASLTVDEPPAITTQPQNQTNSIGELAIMKVVGTGNNLTYQWFFNSNLISGATDNSYTINPVGVTNAGNYVVIITNLAGTTNSSLAALTVVGTNDTELALWNFNSISPDSNTATGSIVPVIGNGTATNIGGTAAGFNDGATADPASTGNDNSAWNLTGYPSQGTSNKTAGVQFTVSTLGYQNLLVSWWQHTGNGSSLYYRFQYTTNGLNYTDGPVITMNQANDFEYELVDLSQISGVNNNSNFAFRVVSEFESTAIGSTNNNYDTATTNNYVTTAGTRMDMVTLLGSSAPPGIISQPQSVTVALGATAQFNVGVASLLPVSYQWFQGGNMLTDGGSIIGSLTANLIISNIVSTNGGNYIVVVSNSSGSVTSSVANLTISNPQPPVIQSLQNAGGGAFVLTWASSPGAMYLVQYTPTLSPPAWTNLAPGITAGGLTLSFTNTPGGPQGYYQIALVP